MSGGDHHVAAVSGDDLGVLVAAVILVDQELLDPKIDLFVAVQLVVAVAVGDDPHLHPVDVHPAVVDVAHVEHGGDAALQVAGIQGKVDVLRADRHHHLAGAGAVPGR